MYQLLVVIISFSLIPILIKRKIKLSYTLLIIAAILAIFSNIGIKSATNSVFNVFLNSPSRSTVLTVMMISILGGLMGHYKILEGIVEALEKVIKNKKNILMIIPAFIGLLVIPGGALLSAPFINNLGEELNVPPPKRAAINLIFRHIAMYIMPFSTGLLIVASSFPDLSIGKIILYNMLFVTLIIITGYFLFIKDIKVNVVAKRENLASNLMKLVILTSPIYLPVVISLSTGLPFYVTLLISIVVVYFLGSKKNFIIILVKSISWHTILTMIAILIIKEIILNMDSLLEIFMTMFSNNDNIFYTLLIFFVTSLFFGFITGNQGASLAIILPMISQLNVSNNMLYIYIYFAYVSAFMGYYFSPLHLCQAFTVELMGVNTVDLYKEYKYYAPIMFVILIGTFFFLRLIAG
jgi:integral membrane protein (TIGR00529 family)